MAHSFTINLQADFIESLCSLTFTKSAQLVCSKLYCCLVDQTSAIVLVSLPSSD